MWIKYLFEWVQAAAIAGAKQVFGPGGIVFQGCFVPSTPRDLEEDQECKQIIKWMTVFDVPVTEVRTSTLVHFGHYWIQIVEFSTISSWNFCKYKDNA